jgi:transposase
MRGYSLARRTWDNQVVAVKDLHLKGMVKKHKLAQAISDASWNQFLALLRIQSEALLWRYSQTR